jgi:hypothetical protein
VAIVLEAICGWLGFLGVGYLLRGRIGTGVALMLVWWLVLVGQFFLVVVSLGAGVACLGPIWFVVPLLSAFALMSQTRS